MARTSVVKNNNQADGIVSKYWSIIVPTLFGTLPIISFFAGNIGEVSPGDMLVPIAGIAAANLVLFLLLDTIFKAAEKEATLLVAFWVVFFNYANLAELGNKLFSNNAVSKYFATVVSALIVSAVIFLLIKFQSLASKLLKPLFIAGLLLLLLQCSIIVFSVTRSNDDTVPYVQNPVQGVNIEAVNNRPDIYFILPDAYPRSDVLKEYFGFDNEEFDNFLKNNNFFLAEKSRANYYHTALSGPSSLNMSYIERIDGKVSAPTLTELFINSRLSQLTEEMGYTYVNNTDFHLSAHNPYADINTDCTANNEFTTELIRTTPLSEIGLLADIERENKRKGTLCVIDNINDSNIEGPKFVLTHLLPPHPPYLFGENGEDIKEVDLSLSSATRWQSKEPFIGQLKFINNRLQMEIKEILDRSPNSIIIVNSDHGTLSSSGKTRINDKRPIVFKERSSNFIAVHLPDYCDEGDFYENMTSVNTLRLVFNACFGTDYEILEDKVFYSPASTLEQGIKMHTNFEDITNIVKD